VIGAAAAATAQTPVGLPSPTQQLTPSPPLQGNIGLSELRIPGRVSSRQVVFVGLDATGAPVSVGATQRLTLSGKGDYSFVVPAPLEDVLPAEGTDSQPGFRKDAIVWQGFSPGRRVLGARVKLRLRATAPSLPVRVSVETKVGGSPLEPGETRSGPLTVDLAVRNATPAPDVVFRAKGVPAGLARVLDALRGSIESGGPFGTYTAVLRSRPVPYTAQFEGPVLLRGTLTLPRGTVTGLTVDGRRVPPGPIEFSARLGDGDPLRYTLHLSGTANDLGTPNVTMRVQPTLRLRALRPPRGRTWTQAIARGLVPADGEHLLTTAIATLLRTSRARQYESFLSNPDLLIRAGGDRTVYLYRTVAAVRAAPVPAPGGGGSDVLVPVLASIGGVLLAAGLVVLWAHS
jgi:hypothetical protein